MQTRQYTLGLSLKDFAIKATKCTVNTSAEIYSNHQAMLHTNQDLVSKLEGSHESPNSCRGSGSIKHQMQIKPCCQLSVKFISCAFARPCLTYSCVANMLT